VRPATAVDTERKHVARQLIGEIRRIDKQLDDNRTRTRTAVDRRPHRLPDIFGISHVLAAKILGHTGPIERFATADAYANYTGTAPIEVSSGDMVRHRLSRSGNRHLNNACTWPLTSNAPTPGRAATTTDARSPRARASERPCAASNARSPSASTGSSAPTTTPPTRRRSSPPLDIEALSSHGGPASATP
jgi:transposase